MDEIIESIVNGTNPRTILDHINKFKVEYLDKKTKPILRSQVTQLWNLLIASDTQDELANLTSAYGRELCYLIMKDMLQNDCNIIEEENTLCLMQMASRCERSFLIINSRQWVIYAADIEGFAASLGQVLSNRVIHMRNEALAVHFGSSLYVLANEIQTKQSDPDYSLKIRTILDKAIEKLSLSTIESELWDLLCTFLKNYEFNLALMCELKRVETPLHPVGYNLAKKLTEKYILNNENMLIIDSLTALYPNILDSPLGRSINFRRLLSKGMSVEDLLSSHGHDLSIEDGIKISKMTKTPLESLRVLGLFQGRVKDTLWSLGSALEYCILMCQIGLQVNVSTELIIPVIKKFEKYWPHVDLGELLSLLLQNAKLLINQGLITQALSFCELVTDLHQKSTFYKGNESNFKTIQMMHVRCLMRLGRHSEALSVISSENCKCIRLEILIASNLVKDGQNLCEGMIGEGVLTAAELIEACRIFIDAKEFEFTIQIIEKSLENPNYENDEIGKILGIAIQVLSMLDGDVAAKKLIDLMPKYIARISGDHLIPAGILDSIWNICVDLQRANRHEEVYQVISLSNSLFAGSVNMKIMFSAMLIKSYLELGKATKPSISKHVRRISRECLNLVSNYDASSSLIRIAPKRNNMESKCLLNSKAHKDDDGGVVDNDHLLDSQEVAELPLTKEIVENIVNMIVSIEILEVLESSSYTDGEIFQKISDGTWTVSALQMAACCHLESQSMPNFKVLSVMLGGIASHCLRDDDNESLVRFALLLRGMIISAIICNQDGLCDEVFNLFQQASEMIHLAGGKYPEDEVIWLVTKSYNISKTDGCQTKSQRLCKESLSMCRWINQVGLRQKYELVIRAEYGKLLLGSLA